MVVTFTGAPAGLQASVGSLTDNGGGTYTLEINTFIGGGDATCP